MLVCLHTGPTGVRGEPRCLRRLGRRLGTFASAAATDESDGRATQDKPLVDETPRPHGTLSNEAARHHLERCYLGQSVFIAARVCGSSGWPSGREYITRNIVSPSTKRMFS